MGIVLRNGVILSFFDFLIKTLHILSFEGRMESTHFVNQASEGPNISLKAIGLIPPNLWTCIIRGASLSKGQVLFCLHFGHIHVANFIPVVGDEDVGCLQVTM